LAVTAVVGLLVFILVWKIAKTIFQAFIAAILFAVITWYMLPTLVTVEGPVGEKAREAQEVIDKAQDAADRAREKARQTGEQLKEKGDELKESGEKLKEAGEKLSKEAGAQLDNGPEDAPKE